MKVMVTGSSGYLGSAFVERYGDDYEIIPYNRSDGNNILDYDNLQDKSKNIDQIVHLAAIPGPIESNSFEDYFTTNVRGTLNVAKAANENNVKRIVYASSTTVYGIEEGIPFKTPITETSPFVSQYLNADELETGEADLSYHVSKVMAEQILAWYGLNKKVETAVLRFGPIGNVFLGTSVSLNNATQAIKLAIEHDGDLWYEPFNIVDDLKHISNHKAKDVLGYEPEEPEYSEDQVKSTLGEKTK